MSNNRQLALNMLYQIAGLVINMGITFLLTPFIIKSLGVEAYGFIGLSNNILGYLQLATIALNSMAGRFVTIEYHKGNIENANRYFTSVFYSNCIFAVLIFAISLLLLYYLEFIIEIPSYLVTDVKWLFFLMSANSAGTIMFNLFGVSTFIKNRLDISTIRQLFSNAIRALSLFLLFAVFSPRLWYMGISGILCSVYLVFANLTLCRQLTPELRVKKDFFDWEKIKELVSSGVWNLICKLGDILQRGLDLLFANWWINASAMGILSITTNLPFIILSVFSMLSAAFAPMMTADFANGDIESIKRDLGKSIRILSICMLLPLSVLYVYGDSFYSLWVPTEDSTLLQWLTISGTIALIFTSPLESFWNVFTVTNKIKGSSLFVLFNSFGVFFTVLISLQIVDDIVVKMFIIASARSLWGVLRGLLFLPIYSAHCLNMKWMTFYPMMLKPIIGLTLTLCVVFSFRLVCVPSSWGEFFLMSLCVCVVAFIVGLITVLSKSDRLYLYSRIKERI